MIPHYFIQMTDKTNTFIKYTKLNKIKTPQLPSEPIHKVLQPSDVLPPIRTNLSFIKEDYWQEANPEEKVKPTTIKM